MLQPAYLQKGDTIAITCTAGYMPLKNVKACVKALQLQGYKVIVSSTVGGKSKNYFSANDDIRLAELQKYLNDPTVKAILCGRGGYGTVRIIDKIDFAKFTQSPKWIIGFSDITILLSHIFTNFNIASIHGPMSTAFNSVDQNVNNTASLLSTLSGGKHYYTVNNYFLNKHGTATGTLLGGNLALLANAVGTASDMDTKRCILFIEDIGELNYSVDRMLHQLKRSGKFKNLAGLVIGNFTDCKDTDRPFGKTIYEIVNEIVAEYNFPVCYNFPVGHGKDNVALKVGVKYNLTVHNNGVVLEEC